MFHRGIALSHLPRSTLLSPHQLPTISSYHEAAVASSTRSRWLAQLHWKLPRLAPPALSARSPERRTLPAHRLPREAPTSHRSPSRLPHLCSPCLSCRLFSISPTFVTKLEFGQYLSSQWSSMDIISFHNDIWQDPGCNQTRQDLTLKSEKITYTRQGKTDN